MDLMHRTPFKVGDRAEAKSFTSGYRGAWFRCEIKAITFKKGHLCCSLEYFDFPGERITWTRMYQKPPKCSQTTNGKDLVLMLRPCFPVWCMESQISDQPANALRVVVDGDWQVGDSVDWWFDGCFWSAKITHLSGDGNAKIELMKPPNGEGGSYCAKCKDFRPSLDWTIDDGWTVPISMENGVNRYAARLLSPNDAGRIHRDILLLDPVGANGHSNEGPIVSEKSSVNRLVKPLEKPMLENFNGSSEKMKHPSKIYEVGVKMSTENLEARCNNRPVSADIMISSSLPTKIEEPKSTPGAFTNSGLECECSNAALPGHAAADDSADLQPCAYDVMESIWMRRHWASPENSDSIESSIRELEELQCKIRWLKGLLQHGTQWSTEMEPSWRLL